MLTSVAFLVLVSVRSVGAASPSTSNCKLPKLREDFKGDDATHLLQYSSEINHLQGKLIAMSKEHQLSQTPLKDEFPFYHTSDFLHAYYKQMKDQGQCKNAEFNIETETLPDGTNFDVVHIRRGAPKIRSMLVFGEHARELITTETAFTLVNKLCGHAQSEALDEDLNDVEFIIAPNANPISRKKVEDGNVCQRTNENEVDLNRNWSDEHKDRSLEKGAETYPGKRAFSERETQILKNVVDEKQPDIYVNVHSGAYILTYPYGYDSSPKLRANHKEIMEATLKPIKDKYCYKGECPVGNLADKVGYRNPGCDIDYVYDKLGHKTPHVYLFEIFAGYLSSGAGASLLEEGLHTNTSLGCMRQFNPETKSSMEQFSNDWAEAFLDLAKVVAKEKKDQ